MARPRVWLIPYDADWSYGFNARAVARELADRFEIRIAVKGTPARVLRAWRPDLAVDFWWRGHADRLVPSVPILRQVSSHRWGQQRYGELDAAALVARHLRTCAGVIVPSLRLHAELVQANAPAVHHVRKGFDPKLFADQRRRRGDLVVGWAGNAKPDKRVDLIKAAAPDLVIANRRFAHTEMPRFYNGLDVITCASDAEGDPLTLIEGMASGCFPVTVDVGIVPELVRHGENGLVVERSVEAFADAFAWCRANLELVREAGRRNASEMLATRTWKHCAPSWGDAIARTLEGAQWKSTLTA